MKKFSNSRGFTQHHFFNKKSDAGFTLIELLVVIAIIGILSSIVLASLSTARGKGGNAAIRAGMAQMRTQANLYYNINGDYGTVAGGCGTVGTVFVNDTQFAAILTSVDNASPGVPTCLNSIGAGVSWAVSIQMKVPEGSNNYLCVDSIGALKAYVGSPGAVTACP